MQKERMLARKEVVVVAQRLERQLQPPLANVLLVPFSHLFLNLGSPPVEINTVCRGVNFMEGGRDPPILPDNEVHNTVVSFNK